MGCGRTPRPRLPGLLLFSAAEGGHADIIALLLPHVDDLQLDNRRMDQALVAAARGGSAAAVELLLQPWPVQQISRNVLILGDEDPPEYEPRQAAPRTDALSEGNTDAVYEAVSRGNLDVVRLLLSWRDPPPDLPHFLREACTSGRPEVVRLLLEMQVGARDSHKTHTVSATPTHTTTLCAQTLEGAQRLGARELEEGLWIAAFDCDGCTRDGLKVMEVGGRSRFGAACARPRTHASCNT
jgi:ankyrin repeat protein